MSYEMAVKELAPCGIDCSRCVAYENGDIVNLSKELKEKLINFEKFAKKMEKLVPAFKDYEGFINILDHFSKGKCHGCRNGDALNTACATKDCHKIEKVDFCFQCGNYPCSNNSYNDDLYDKWKSNNDKMKNNGVEVFYDSQKKRTRY
ncbi:DUF3795 domain-containing protein [Wukongibacter sp. M2B1]|uniref:DUF3795 domain-containing protein n=1 Tax=Wukongibacter sp. M2B1 TaxID=3088895 RepID=UPI003D7B970A